MVSKGHTIMFLYFLMFYWYSTCRILSVMLCEAGVPVTQTMTNPQTSSNISLLRFHWQGWTCTWTQINPIFLTSCLSRLYTYEYEIRTKMSVEKKVFKKMRFNNRRVFFVVVEIMVLCSLVSHGSVRSVFFLCFLI